MTAPAPRPGSVSSVLEPGKRRLFPPTNGGNRNCLHTRFYKDFVLAFWVDLACFGWLASRSGLALAYFRVDLASGFHLLGFWFDFGWLWLDFYWIWFDFGWIWLG